MKVMCIATQVGRSGIGVVAGQIYTVIDRVTCVRCGMLYYAVAEVPPIPANVVIKRPFCGACGGFMPHTLNRHYRHYRFAPWNPEQLNISIEDANKLYNTTPDKEKVT